jgi:hypothetical protein
MSTVEAVHVEIADAIIEVLVDLAVPMAVEDIVEWLAESGVQASSDDVSAALEGTLAPQVSQGADGRWAHGYMRLDPNQRAVSFAPVDRRILVTSGPGSGKTEVACARAAHAIASGCPPPSVLVISFTRAATAELTARMTRFGAASGTSLKGVEVRTLDSLAWMLQKHLSDQKLLTGSYSDNIARMRDLLDDTPEELREYLDTIKLLMIDEAQDIVGARADLALSLIRSLPTTAGVTIFADPAQAIYGDWSIDELTDVEATSPLHERLMELPGASFDKSELTELHRTNDPTLAGIVSGLRAFALVRDMQPENTYDAAREELERRVKKKRRTMEDFTSMADTSGTSQMFLFRTHGEAVQVSSYLSGAGIAHRLRFPSLPRPIYPWIGRAFAATSTRTVDRSNFASLWLERVVGTRFDTHTVDEAWEILMSVAADRSAERIDLLYLREALSRANPPDEVTRPTLGLSGPIIGTIHGAKGREADHIVLNLSPLRSDADQLEETRVLYVGATRARKSLALTESSARLSYLASHRAWRFINKNGCAQVEFGLAGDIDALSPVDNGMFGERHAIELQDRFAKGLNSTAMWESEKGFTRGSEAGDEWRRMLRYDKDRWRFGACSRAIDHDLWQIAGRFGANRLPGRQQNNLYVFDYTTVARDDDSPDLNRVHPTFARSGFWVCPLVKGFSLVCMGWKGK